MRLLLPLNRVPIALVLGIRTRKPEKMVVQVSNNTKSNTNYISREFTIDGYRELNLNLPQSPKAALIRIYNTNVGDLEAKQDNSFVIEKLDDESLEQCPVRMKKDTQSFVEFAQLFSENASQLSAGTKKPSIYRSNDGKFQFDYYNQIFDKRTSSYVTTPARIGHTSGVIDVSKKDFINYTVPMRMIILLHEYSHKYLNPEINKPIAYETGADINALNIYLSLGYPPTEAYYAFLHVFKDANNEDNAKRMVIIDDFIKKFTKGEIEGSCKFKTNINGR